MIKSKFVTILLVFVTILAALYFRTLVFWDEISDKEIKKMAESQVLAGISAQLRAQIEVKAPALSENEKRELIRRQINQILTTEQERFDQTKQRIERDLRDHAQSKKDSTGYLLESDPYYYYYLTKQIMEHGSISDRFQAGKFFNEKRVAPEGAWHWMTLHPYLGFGFYKLVSLFVDVDLIRALAFVPLVLVLLTVVLYFVLSFELGLGLFSTFIGSLVFILSPMYVQRSAYGWFDTDPYNFIFPILIFYLFIKGVHHAKAKLWMVFAGILTAFYTFFWMGWPFIAIWLVLSCVILEVLVRVLKLPTQKRFYLRRGTQYALSTLVFAAVFMTPSGFIDLVREDLIGVMKFAYAEMDLWPNTFFFLGETKSSSLIKIIFLTGNPISFLIGISGLFFILVHLRNQKNLEFFSRYVPLVLLSISMFAISFKVERFALLFILPLSLLVAYGAQVIFELVSNFLSGMNNATFLKPTRVVFYALFFLIVLAPCLVMAYGGALNVEPIMNRTWYSALKQIDEKTPPDSIINSWWDPGYFIIAVANRRSTADGSTPHFRQTYWLARSFMTADEKEAAGILRMLNTSGNQAFEFLEPKYGTEKSIQLISKILSLNKENAKQVLKSDLSDSESATLLNLTHGSTMPPPSYFFIYDKIVEMNAVLSIVASWDFGRAKALTRLEKAVNIADYGQKTMLISGGVWNYGPLSPLVKKDGSNAYFSNGAQLNLDTMEAIIDVPNSSLKGPPMSLFYIKEGELLEKKLNNPGVATSCLLIQQNGEMSTVLADSRLIRSMLFRLYYLKGIGLRVFKPFIDESDPQTKTTIKVYEVDWDALNPVVYQDAQNDDKSKINSNG